MLLPEHKFLVEKIDPPTKTPDGKHTYQRIVLLKPGWTDEFGEKKGADDLLDCRVWNQKIDNVPLLSKGSKVKAMLNLTGREYLEQDGTISYSTNLSIAKIELL